MIILGIETSCDETAAALIEGKQGDSKVKLLTHIISSSLTFHAKTGGIIPEVAAREQIKYIIPVLKKALKSTPDAIAVTIGPGLIGSLLVGIETAKTLSYVYNIPIIPVNHLIGHIYANWIMEDGKLQMENISFPAIALIVSGGHTDLVLMKDHGKVKWLGGTRDDAAGEALDKIGRLLGLPYPAGATIEKLAQEGNPKRFQFPRPMLDSNDFDFSFSGLKTAVLREVKTVKQPARIATQSVAGGLNNRTIADISAGVQQAIIDILVKKTLKAAQKYNAKSILLGGGVAANQKLREDLKWKMENDKWQMKLFAPPKNLCTDNAAMIAAAAFFNYKPIPWYQISANPELYFN